jgi:hypothetical protein
MSSYSINSGIGRTLEGVFLEKRGLRRSRMPYQAVPKTELEYLLDVERALADVVKPPELMPPPPSRSQESQVAHALRALRRAGLSGARAASFVRSLRAIGIQKPGRFVIALKSDYAQACYRRTVGSESAYLAEDEFESVALLLQTLLYHRPDVARRELSEAAVVLAYLWLETAGYELPLEAPPFLHLEAFHAGVTVAECAAALRALVAWGKTSQDSGAADAGEKAVTPPADEKATLGLPRDVVLRGKQAKPPLESIDPEAS